MGIIPSCWTHGVFRSQGFRTRNGHMGRACRATKGGGALVSIVKNGRGYLVFMDKVEVEGEEQEVECEEVRDPADTSFHKYWI